MAFSGSQCAGIIIMMFGMVLCTVGMFSNAWISGDTRNVAKNHGLHDPSFTYGIFYECTREFAKSEKCSTYKSPIDTNLLVCQACAGLILSIDVVALLSALICCLCDCTSNSIFHCCVMFLASGAGVAVLVTARFISWKGSMDWAFYAYMMGVILHLIAAWLFCVASWGQKGVVLSQPEQPPPKKGFFGFFKKEAPPPPPPEKRGLFGSYQKNTPPPPPPEKRGGMFGFFSKSNADQPCSYKKQKNQPAAYHGGGLLQQQPYYGGGPPPQQQYGGGYGPPQQQQYGGGYGPQQQQQSGGGYGPPQQQQRGGGLFGFQQQQQPYIGNVQPREQYVGGGPQQQQPYRGGLF